MKIKLWETTHRQIEKDIKFPIYREHILSDNCTAYTRIDADLTAITIKEESYTLIDDYTYELEYVCRYKFDKSSINYHLGLGAYALTKEEFDSVFKKFLENVYQMKQKLNA